MGLLITDHGSRTRGQMANGNGEHSQIFPVQHTNGINANDPLYQFHRHASVKAKPLSDREMDRIIYGG